MSLLSRGLFVVGGIVAGSMALNALVFGHGFDLRLPNARLGAWREAKVRPVCFPALTYPKNDRSNPTVPHGQHRIAWRDHDRMVDMTAALHCYVVTQENAVCDPNNRAYVVDYIGKYFAKRDAMLDTAKRYGDDEVRNVRELWNSPNNRAITAALETHIRYGRLNKSDFGWSVPAALKPTLDKYAGAPDRCDKSNPWIPVKM
jgi:hypothetical protein